MLLGERDRYLSKFQIKRNLMILIVIQNNQSYGRTSENYKDTKTYDLRREHS